MPITNVAAAAINRYQGKKWGHFPYSPYKGFRKRLGDIMRRIKFLTNIFLLALLSMILFLPVSTALGYEGGCPSCEGSVLDPLGCCETEDACLAPTSQAACVTLGGSFFLGDMVCGSETQCDKPTAIRLSSFNVTQQNEQNLIFWTTGTEIDTEGFHILRSASPGGPYSRITPSMIGSTGSPYAGGRYSFVDTAVEDGESYYYKLEEVDSKGNIAQYGPVAVVAGEGAGSSSDHPAEVTPTLTLPHQWRGKKEGEQKTDPTPVYTIMAYSEGPAKFLSGEVVDEETVQGIRSQVLEDSSAVIARPEGAKQSHYEGKDEGVATGGDSLSPASIRFRIIDAEGNEVAVASLDAKDNPATPPFSKVGILEDAKSGDFALQNRRDGDRLVLTWYATKPVKGFHILRSTAKDGQYQKITKSPIPYIGTGIEGVTGQIFRFTYSDRNVQKGKDYYYKLEPILRDEDKTAIESNRCDNRCDGHFPLTIGYRKGRERYREFLMHGDAVFEASIKMATSAGRVLGTEKFVSIIEEILDREILPKKAWQPKKE